MTMDSAKKHSFSISLAPGFAWPDLVAQAQQVDTLGFDTVWIPDHFVNPNNPQLDWFEGWTVLAALAAQTSRIRLGTLVSSMTLRNPALLARQALTVDHVSNGRLEFGIGAAGVRHCHEMTGVPFWTPRERSQRYQEWVELLKLLLTQEETTYNGRYYQVKAAQMHPPFVQKPHPPLHVAAHGPKALKLAATFGDGWNSFFTGSDLSAKQSSDLVRERSERLNEFALNAGRRPDDIRRLFCFGWTADKPFVSKDALFDAVGRYAEAGINEFCFFYVPGVEAWREQSITSAAQLTQVAEEYIPVLR